MSDAAQGAPTGFVMDRILQREMLDDLRAVYPDGITRRELLRAHPGVGGDGNLTYLHEHGLCETRPMFVASDRAHGLQVHITAAGVDFLADDGGLTAILGVVTIKLHADTIRDLLAKKIDESDLPTEKKSAIKEAISKLPGAALTAATGDLAKMGLEHAPGALHWIERLVGL